MALLTVNSHDYTKYIVSGSWEVNHKDVYKSWTDANGINRRNVYRTRIEGEFSMQFLNRTAYGTFMSDLAAVKTAGYYPVTVYANDTQTAVSANVYLNMEPAMEANYSTPLFGKFSVKLEER